MTTEEVVIAVFALLALLVLPAFASWRMLLRLSRQYAAKKFSEVQLSLGAYWALITAFSVGLVLLLSFEKRTEASMEWVTLAILLVWVVWRWLSRVALRWANRGDWPATGSLLMLRVFKPSDRSEAFTDRFLARWRFAGPVWMIGGPDLAGAFMEPDEFFAFLRGRLEDQFIVSADKIEARVAALDGARDPDGRYRVAELFCSATTWKPAVQTLIERADVVLLDLREYNPARAGTRFEIEELLRRAVLDKLLVIVDAADDLQTLREEVESIWQRVAPLDAAHQELQLISLAGDSDADMFGLFRAAATTARRSA